MYDIYKLNEKSLVELKEIARKLGIENINISKEELVYSIIDQQAVHPDIIKEIKNTKHISSYYFILQIFLFQIFS